MPRCRNFFATAHAKGEQDSAGGLVKSACRKACFDPKNSKFYSKILDVVCMFNFCVNHLGELASSGSKSHDSRKTLNKMWFSLVSEEANSRNRPEMKTIKANRKSTQSNAAAMAPSLNIENRMRGCYCERCYPSNERPAVRCTNARFVDSWKPRTMVHGQDRGD